MIEPYSGSLCVNNKFEFDQKQLRRDVVAHISITVTIRTSELSLCKNYNLKIKLSLDKVYTFCF